jgi:hypothetical protein
VWGRTDSSVTIVAVLRASRPRVTVAVRRKISLFSTAFIPALEPTKPLVEWVPGAPSPESKAAGE